MENKRDNLNHHKHVNERKLESDFSDNYSEDNFSNSSENFIYSPLKCHYPSSYIPSDGYKISKCIRIKKHSSKDEKRHKKNKNNEDSSRELSIKKHMEYLQNDRNIKMEKLLKKSDKNSRNDESNIESTNVKNDDSFFSIYSIPSISSFSFGSSDQTKSTIKRIYKNYMNSISIDSPSKLSNETFLKYIETPIFEKTKVMFSKEEKKAKPQSENIFDISLLSNKNNNDDENCNKSNIYELYYSSADDDNKSINSYLSKSPIIQYQKNILSNEYYENDDNAILTPKSNNSSSPINNPKQLLNLSIDDIKEKNNKSSKSITSISKTKENNKKSLLELYSSPKYDTIPSFINNVTSKFDSEINYIKENPLLVSSLSYSSKNPLKYTSNKNSETSVMNDTLDDISITNEDIELESLINPNFPVIDKDNLSNNKNAFNPSVKSQRSSKKDKENIENTIKANLSFESNDAFTESVCNSVINDSNIYTPKYIKKTSIKDEKTSIDIGKKSKKEEEEIGSYEIISPTESFERILINSNKSVKHHDIDIGRKKYNDKNNRYNTSKLNKNFNDILFNIDNKSDDQSDEEKHSKKEYKDIINKKVPQKESLKENIMLSDHFLLKSDASFLSLNSNQEENDDIFILGRKNKSYDSNKYRTNTNNSDYNVNDIYTSKNINPDKIKRDNVNTNYKININQFDQSNYNDNKDDNLNNILSKYEKENISSEIKNESKLKSSNDFNKIQINENKSVNNFSTLINDNEEEDILSDVNQKEFKKFNEIINDLSNVQNTNLYHVQTYTTSTQYEKIPISSANKSNDYTNFSFLPPLIDEKKNKMINSFSEIDYHLNSNKKGSHNSHHTYQNSSDTSIYNGKTMIIDEKEVHHQISFDSSDMIIENDDNDELELPIDKLNLSQNEDKTYKDKVKKEYFMNDSYSSILYNLKENKILNDASFDNNYTTNSYKPSSSNRKQSIPTSKSSLLSPISPNINFSLNSDDNDSFFNYSIIEPSILKNKSNDYKDDQSELSINHININENHFSSSKKIPASSSRSPKIHETDKHYGKEITKSSSLLSSPTLLNYYHQELEKESEGKSGKKFGKYDDFDLYEKLMNESDKNNMKLVCDIITRMNTIQTDLNRKFEMQSKLLEDLMTVKEDDNHDAHSDYNIPPLYDNDNSSSFHFYNSNHRHGSICSSNNSSSVLTDDINKLSSSYYLKKFRTLKSYQKDIEKLNKYQSSNMEYLLEIIRDIKDN
ncbi:hypothetical protein BCR36DRAFT_360527 [Piromyces finnis]|uniref:Uncharacterized protein n=1 Tax=Piromyces finnis TaxID=1754191 RepID=A0A1Y1UZ56_9FUNG|nr:hypothetical protein BCR36DRAFT_360527 [Piromyces finnis]|eukprot:ORX43761.1 hypothetical protein BCR36DRAFT_360527 [Piromyces finnis]